ncbi:hypothetical protein IFR05_000369 [Cadophora sp. M221]|nr:hypothetical protein IFR05_000369 [Cadophora sp. M221]
MAGSYESGVFRNGTSSSSIDDGLGWISNFGAFVCMLALQYLLLKIHRLRRVLAVEAIPRVSEVWFGVGAFWIGQLLLDVAAIAILRVVFNILFHPGFAAENKASYALISRISSFIRVLIDRILVSWMLHHGLVILLDIIIPFTKDRRRNPHRELTNVISRTSQLLTFIHSITLGSATNIAPHMPLKIFIQDSNSRSTTQTVRLQRTQSDHPNEGQRTLAWNLVVDKDALDEMKETLGPPGGFGELGFSVGGDGIRFEAMGVGTSFVLDFEIAVTDRRPVVTARRKTK